MRTLITAKHVLRVAKCTIFVVLSACTKSDSKVSRIEVPAEISLGEYEPESVVDFEIPVKNSGSSKVVISKVTTSCACLVTTSHRSTLLPGESCTVAGRVKLPLREGRTDQSVTLSLEGTETAKREVKLLLSSKREIRIVPDRLMLLGNESQTFPLVRAINLEVSDPMLPLQRIEMQSDIGFVTCKEVERNGQGARMEVVIQSTSPSGEIDVGIPIKVTAGGRLFQRQLRIAGIAKHEASATPSVALFSGNKPGSITLNIRPNTLLDSCVPVVVYEEPDSQDMIAVQVGKDRTITLGFKQTVGRKWSGNATLLFNSKETNAPLLSVPIYVQ